ncbi:MAG: Hsp70 family protein [Bacteroidetes bacterium]|nr:Hsp70 family protein [Bacteroidota bacterium]
MSKINFGIDLGTTNSAIAKIENGKPMIVTTGRADIIPSCVAIQNGGRFLVGDRAKIIYAQEKEKELRDGTKPNSFIEFKREMSNPFTYHSTNLGRDISPEELSAEVLKTLKSFVTTEKLNSIVVTVPAKFNIAQKQATINAGTLAGFDLVVLLEEPVAACLAYNMEAQNNKGTWLVFDFGGGTFDAALVKKDDDGMIRIIDTGGDSELGGKDLDLAIVDKLILPYLYENYNLSSYKEDEKKSEFLRSVIKRFAEESKLELSFQQSTDLLKTYPGDIELKDDDGKDICLNIDFNQNILHTVLEPIHQRAIDLALKVIEKNNLTKKNLDAVILVGGPTLSPVFQKMIKTQISDKIDTSVNPMTIVAKGAALFASTKDAITGPGGDEEVVLDINYETATLEKDTLINVRINKEKTKAILPDKVTLVVERGDNGFNIQQEININKLSLIELQLNVGVNNVFNLRLIDDKGNNLVCIPKSISFLPIHIPDAKNNSFFGIEIWDNKKEIGVFKSLKGLEKNKLLKNAVGVISDIKTPKQLVPGKSEDTLEIRIFQGEDNAEGKDSFLSDHVTSVIITGDDVEKVIPAKSAIEVTLRFDENGGIPTCSVFFPDINWTHKVELKDFKSKEVDANWVSKEIDKDISRIEEYLEENNSSQVDKCLLRLGELKQDLINNENNPSGRITVLKNVRENRREIENHISVDEWPKVSEELKEAFFRAEGLVEKLELGEFGSNNIDKRKIKTHLEEFRSKVEQIIRSKETELAKELTEDINDLSRVIITSSLPDGFRERMFIENMDETFNERTWVNPTKARQFINQAIRNINNDGNLDELESLCSQISDLIDRTKPQPPIPERN